MKTVYVSSTADEKMKNYLKKIADRVVILNPRDRTYQAIDTHPDIYYCRMGISSGSYIFEGNPDAIGKSYPENIRFNAVCLDRYFIHNLKYTFPALLREAQTIGLDTIHVRQGYTKCSCVVVDGHSIITADAGIIGKLKKYPDIDVLPVCQGCVKLDGFDYGFLGGASGRVGDEIIFNGNLSAHPDAEAISRFIGERGLSIKYFTEYPLTDIGSILADF